MIFIFFFYIFLCSFFLTMSLIKSSTQVKLYWIELNFSASDFSPPTLYLGISVLLFLRNKTFGLVPDIFHILYCVVLLTLTQGCVSTRSGQMLFLINSYKITGCRSCRVNHEGLFMRYSLFKMYFSWLCSSVTSGVWNWTNTQTGKWNLYCVQMKWKHNVLHFLSSFVCDSIPITIVLHLFPTTVVIRTYLTHYSVCSFLALSKFV